MIQPPLYVPKMDRGYVRDGAPGIQDDHAVRWWFYARDGEYRFARGGRCRTTRQARHLLHDSFGIMQRDRLAFVKRPTHELLPDG